MTRLNVNGLKKMHERVKELVINKMGNMSSCTITHKSGREFIFAKDQEGYTLYEGCELVIGDCTLDHCIAAMISETECR